MNVLLLLLFTVSESFLYSNTRCYVCTLYSV